METTIQPLSHQEVRALHLRSWTEDKAFVDHVLGKYNQRERVSAALRQEAVTYTHQRRMNQSPVTIRGLKSMLTQTLNGTAPNLGTRTQRLRHTFDSKALLQAAMQCATNTNRDDRKSFQIALQLFNGALRLYFPLLPTGKTLHQEKIETYLDINGFTDIDYAEGYARDEYGRKRKIGKILRESPDIVASLLKMEYDQDTGRQFNAKRQDIPCLLVLSRSPYDLFRMSTARSWKSCARMGDSPAEMSNAMDENGLIAYLVREDDPNIADPLARSFIRYTFKEVIALTPKQKAIATINERQWGTDYTTYKTDVPRPYNVPVARFESTLQQIVDDHFNHEEPANPAATPLLPAALQL